MTELWLPVAGYEGLYEVSNRGQVRSLGFWMEPRAGASRWWKPGRVLTPWQHRTGHWNVVLVGHGRRTTWLVHRLVALAFVGPQPEGMECCHIDGDASNNSAENLRWDTHAANMADTVRHGTSLRGERAPAAKLTEAQVLAIRSDVRKCTDIAADYGVHPSSVSALKRGKSWGHLGGAHA